jgi:hypothetical protein
MKLLIFVGAGLLLGVASCSSIKNMSTTSVSVMPHNKDLLQVQEKTISGKTIDLASNMKVVEPNSNLVVIVNKAALSDQLAGTELSPDVTAKLGSLLAMIQQQKAAMQDVTDALLINNKDPKSVEWQPYMKKLGSFVRLIRDNPQTKAIFNATLPANSTILQSYQTLFTTAALYIIQLEAQIQQEAKANGVYLQLGAWLDTKNGQTPIHIPGYDDYTSRPSSVVEQFQYTLTAEQKQELTAISTLSTNVNQKGLGTALQVAINSNGGLLKVLNTLPSYKMVVAIQDTLETMLNAGNTTLAALKAPITDIHQALQSYVSDLNNVIKTFSTVSASTTPNQLLNNVNNNITDLATKTAALKTSLTTDMATIKVVGTTADTKAMAYIQNLPILLNGLADSLQNDFAHLKTNINDLLNTAITEQNLTNATYDFTTKVNQFSIDKALQPAVINLELAGVRDEGDMVTIKLATGKAGLPVVEQALIQYHLYFCSLYARTATGFLFINPVPLFQTSNGKALFRNSPSYSVLLKGFWKGELASRQNLSYHSIFNPGVGVNFSALNINPNGTTELGIGGVFTLFNDFFQTGYGFDTVSGRGYMFFGFKIPVGSFSFK